MYNVYGVKRWKNFKVFLNVINTDGHTTSFIFEDVSINMKKRVGVKKCMYIENIYQSFIGRARLNYFNSWD